MVSSHHDSLAVPAEQEMSACPRAELDAWTREFVKHCHHVACIGMYSLLPRSLQRQVQQQLKVLALRVFKDNDTWGCQRVVNRNNIIMKHSYACAKHLASSLAEP